MLFPSLAPAAEYYKGKIYVFGGDIDGIKERSRIDYGDSIVQVYDMASKTWSETTPMPARNLMHGSAVVGDTLYVVGGGWWNGGVNTLYAFDPVTETWFERDTLSMNHGMTSACALDGKVYCIGGSYTENGVEMYDPSTGKWTKKASYNEARGGVATVATGGKIYLIGGATDGANSLSTVEAYDPVTDEWTTMTPMYFNRFGVVAAAAGKWIVVMGGTRVNSMPSPGIVEVYNIEEDFWYSNNEGLPIPTQWAASCDNDTMAYLVGGEDKCSLTWPPGSSNGAKILDIFFEYDLSSYVPIPVGTIKDRFFLSSLSIAPVPAGDEIRIRYELTDVGMTSIKLYTYDGKLIAVINNQYESPGIYDLSWNSSHLPAGLYICRFTQGEKAVSKKLLIER
jgi:N-acetylneuraminic acid mutarotase